MKLSKVLKIVEKMIKPFYICPLCNYSELKNTFIYCPKCGREIEIFVNNKKVNNNKKVELLYKEKYNINPTDDFMRRYPL
jgi:hypothetical protein